LVCVGEKVLKSSPLPSPTITIFPRGLFLSIEIIADTLPSSSTY
jgi:hypothetical protein